MDNEKQLIKKAKAGDIDSFEILISQSKSKAFNIAMRYLNNQEDAMDAVQESYIKVFKGLNSFRENSSFDTWVYRIIINTCNDFVRKNAKHKEDTNIYYDDGEQIEELANMVDNNSQPENILIRHESVKFLLSCLGKLPGDQKEVIILRDLQNFSYDEIAEMLECSEGTVKSRIHRGRNALRLMLQNNMELL